MEMNSQVHIPVALPLEKGVRVPLHKKLDGLQSPVRCAGEKKIPCVSRVSNSRRLARSPFTVLPDCSSSYVAPYVIEVNATFARALFVMPTTPPSFGIHVADAHSIFQ
jgi:hypothetical protein